MRLTIVRYVCWAVIGGWLPSSATAAMVVPYKMVYTAAPLGADFSTLTKAQALKLGITGGVVVVSIQSGGAIARQTKMQAGFIITRIGNMPVNSVSELNAAVTIQKASFQIQGIYPGSKQVIFYSIHEF